MLIEELRGTLVVPKSHSNSGEDTPCSCGVISAEHRRVTVSPAVAVIGAEGEMATGPMSTGGRNKDYMGVAM